MQRPAILVFALSTALFSACSTLPPVKDDGWHLHATPATHPEDIPAPVTATPYVPPPQASAPLETYTAVVTDVPVKEFLFSLAREAKVNVDIHPSISGTVTLNAIDQTLPQILDRISKQTDLRYRYDGKQWVITPDLPYLHTYKIDYVNMSRDAKSTVSVATQIATTGAAATGGGGGGGSNNSDTQLTNTSNNRLWDTLEQNIRALTGDTTTGAGASQQVILSREASLLTVRATQRVHAEIQTFLDQVLGNAKRQVLIEATLVEVELNQQHQTGVDWQRLADGNGLSIVQSLVGTNLASTPFTSVGYALKGGNVNVTLRLLEQFGNVHVLSSPKIMALNNQTAMLKVVDNKVYFTTDVQSSVTVTGPTVTYTTTIHTVPVGFVMNVTPQVNDADTITLNLRPTISRIIGFVQDPNPDLAKFKVKSQIPEIQVREMESILKVESGQTAVMGGLIQDTTDNSYSGLPWLSQLPFIGNLFKYRKDEVKKTELVIFLRPVVVRNASIDSDLNEFRALLPAAATTTRNNAPRTTP